MKALILVVSLFIGGATIATVAVHAPQAQADCKFYCDPKNEVYACGGNCIQNWKQCHKPYTYGCNTAKPAKKKNTYTKDQIKNVEPGQETETKAE